VVVVAAVVLHGGVEVGSHLGQAERHVAGVGGAVEVAGEGAEARRRQPGALLRQCVAEGPVGDEAVPPAYIDTARKVTDTYDTSSTDHAVTTHESACALTPHHKFTTHCSLLDL
jgi:hypothetical protein